MRVHAGQCAFPDLAVPDLTVPDLTVHDLNSARVRTLAESVGGVG